MKPMICEAIHFPTILLPAAIGFFLGVLTDRLLVKAKERKMKTNPRTRPRLNAVYDRLAPFLVVLCLAASTYASISTYHQQGVNHAQQVQRDKDQAARTADNTALIKCFDQFATDLSGSLPPVRRATATRDDALGSALGTSGGLAQALVKISNNRFEPEDLATLISGLLAYDHANKHLAKVRANNPYPPPPSKFCDLP